MGIKKTLYFTISKVSYTLRLVSNLPAPTSTGEDTTIHESIMGKTPFLKHHEAVFNPIMSKNDNAIGHCLVREDSLTPCVIRQADAVHKAWKVTYPRGAYTKEPQTKRIYELATSTIIEWRRNPAHCKSF